MKLLTLITNAAVAVSTFSFAAPALAYDARWGLLANPELDQQPLKGTYFFAGEAQCANGVSGATVNCDLTSYEEITVGPNYTFTFTPTDPANLLWHSQPPSRASVLSAMSGAHVNTVVASSWVGTDWHTSAPMQTAPEAIDELFTAATFTNLVIEPAIETGGAFSLRESYPATAPQCALDPTNPAPALVAEIVRLVRRYVQNPSNPQWPSHWAKIYDQSGYPRYAINLVNASSACSVADDDFVHYLDYVMDAVLGQTGVVVGFTVDAVRDPSGFSPDPSRTNFAGAVSFLAIQNFLTEHLGPWVGGSGNSYLDNNVDGEMPSLAQYKHDKLAAWVATGVPVYIDVSPGYDGRYVWAGRFPNAGWGSTADYYQDDWRNYQGALRSLGAKGVVFDSWNGYTEGMVAVPSWRVPTQNHADTSDYPFVTSVNLSWMSDVLAADPRYCNHVQYSGFGAIKYYMYGSICDAWASYGSVFSFLGNLLSSEEDTPNHAADGGRKNEFQFGTIYWSGGTGAHEVHGIIGSTYHSTYGEDNSSLGLPISDEQAWTNFYACSGGRISRFQNGNLCWCPGDTVAYPGWYCY